MSGDVLLAGAAGVVLGMAVLAAGWIVALLVKIRRDGLGPW